MIDTSVAWVAFLLQCGAIAFRLRQLAGRRIAGPDRAALGIYLFAALAIATVLPGVYQGIDRLVHVPNAIVLLGCCAAITSGWCVQVLHLHGWHGWNSI